MTHLSQTPTSSDFANREARVESYIEVEIEQDFGASVPAIVRDVSEYGMGLTTSAMLQVFDVITIVKSGYGRIRAEVRWVDADRIGVLFSEPVGMGFFDSTNI